MDMLVKYNHMIVTEITELAKNKYVIRVDEEFYCILYGNEVRRMDIEVGKEITEKEHHWIMEELIHKRAKEKALRIVERSMKTEHEIRIKLEHHMFPDDIIDRVMEFLKEYRFIDDENYAQNYIQSHQKRKSKMNIKYSLKNKGVDAETIEEQFVDYDDSNEEEAIRKILDKHRDKDGVIPKDKMNKIVTSLYRKGFKNSTIFKNVHDNLEK